VIALGAELHPLVAGPRLRSIGTEESIPPGQVEAEVAVALVDFDRVMHSMHIGGNEDPPKPAVDADREADVAVIEHRSRVEQDREDEDRGGWRAKGRDDRELDDDREDNLKRMRADSGSQVEVLIRVMDHVEAPEGWDRVEHHVLKIDGEIQENHGHDDGEGKGETDPLEEPPTPALGEKSETHRRGRPAKSLYVGMKLSRRSGPGPPRQDADSCQHASGRSSCP
jgi:hypothetical protein